MCDRVRARSLLFFSFFPSLPVLFFFDKNFLIANEVFLFFTILSNRKSEVFAVVDALSILSRSD